MGAIYGSIRISEEVVMARAVLRATGMLAPLLESLKWNIYGTFDGISHWKMLTFPFQQHQKGLVDDTFFLFLRDEIPPKEC